MSEYRVSAVDGRGKRVVVTRGAEDRSTLLRVLSSEGLYPVAVDPCSPSGKRGGPVHADRKTVLEFTESAALMLESGISFRDALDVLSLSGSERGVKELAKELAVLVRRGMPFSDAINDAWKGFPPVYRGLVRVGERTGTIATVMKNLSSYLEEERRLREKIRGALIYPSLVLSTALLGMVFLAAFILPGMEDVFTALGGMTAEHVRNMSASLATAMALGLFLPAAAFPSAVFLSAGRRRFPRLELWLSKTILKLPVIGGFLVTHELSAFAFAMETLCAGGIPLEEALRQAMGVMKNMSLVREIGLARDDVLRGVKLSEAFASKRLPESLRMWTAIGEETGHAETVFRRLKAYYGHEMELVSSRFMAAVEPAATLVTGVLILLLVVGFIVPLFGLYGAALG